MAKLKGPLFSLGAHGAINKSLIYSHKKGNNITRKFHYPKKEASLKQWTQRHIIGLLTAHWQVKNAAEKKVYNDLAANSELNIPGFNYFLKVAQQNLKSHHGLCGYWSMNESTGNQTLDYSGNGNHGTLKPSYPSNCPTREAAMIKQYGNALNFNGINDDVDCGKLDITDWTEVTMSGWVYIVEYDYGANGGFLASIIHSNTDDIRLTLGFNGWVSFGVDDGNVNNVNYQMDSSYNGTWVYVTGTFDGTNSKVYVNGDLKNTVMDTFNFSTADGQTNIGHRINTNYYYNGLIDEVRIYDRALGEAEILKQYNLLRLNKQRQPLIIH